MQFQCLQFSSRRFYNPASFSFEGCVVIRLEKFAHHVLLGNWSITPVNMYCYCRLLIAGVLILGKTCHLLLKVKKKDTRHFLLETLHGIINDVRGSSSCRIRLWWVLPCLKLNFCDTFRWSWWSLWQTRIPFRDTNHYTFNHGMGSEDGWTRHGVTFLICTSCLKKFNSVQTFFS